MVERSYSTPNLHRLNTPGYKLYMLFILCILISILPTTSTVTTHHLPEDHIHTIVKRSQVTSYENFRITNLTFPCQKSQASISLSNIFSDLPDNIVLMRVEDLNDNEMRDFMKYKGATDIQDYGASEKIKEELQEVQKQRFRRVTQTNLPGSRLVQQIMGNKFKEEKRDSRYRRRRQIPKREVCIQAGQQSEDDPNYLHLCTRCTSKRNLPINRYPESITEVYCSDSSTGCLGNNNGKCITTVYYAYLLKRKEGVCRFCMRGNDALAVVDWETYQEPIKVGCECMLDKNSDYRNRWFNNNEISNAVG